MAKLKTFQDDFDDNSIDSAKWNQWGGAQVYESGGELSVDTITTSGYYGMSSQTSYDLVASEIFLEVVAIGGQGLTSYGATPLKIETSGSAEFVEYGIFGGNVNIRVEDGTGVVTVHSETYNATNHRWLRIREDSGTTYFDRSTDGITWVTMHSMSNPFTLTALFVVLVAGQWQNEGVVTTMTIDNLNIDQSSPPAPSTHQRMLTMGVG